MVEPSFPRQEFIDDLVGDATYVEAGIRWRVFEDLDGELPGRNVLVVLGNQFTILNGAQFKALALRILPQL